MPPPPPNKPAGTRTSPAGTRTSPGRGLRPSSRSKKPPKNEPEMVREAVVSVSASGNVSILSVEDNGERIASKKGGREFPQDSAAPSPQGRPPAQEELPDPPKNALQALSQHPLFDNFILSCIVINSIALAITDPKWNDPELSSMEILALKTDPNSTELQKLLTVLDIVLLYVFTVEMLVKMAGYCFDYFRDSWNLLDFAIVVVGWIGLVPGVANFTVLRVLRVLRPLRSINKLKGMKDVINTLLLTLPELFNVFLLAIFTILVFGILGMDLFMGVWQQRCFNPDTMERLPDEETAPISDRLCGGEFSCPDGYKCFVAGPNEAFGDGYATPYYGIVNFNDIGHAALTIFTGVTLEGWADSMYMAQDSYNYWGSTLYWLILILFAGLFLVNLALAVVADKFAEIQLEDEQRKEEEAQWATSHPGLLEAAADADDKEPEPLVDQIVVLANLARADWFNSFIMFCIFLNTVTMAMTHTGKDCLYPSGLSEAEASAFDAFGAAEDLDTASGKYCIVQAIEMDAGISTTLLMCNYAFVVIFTFEMVVRLGGLGWRGYKADSFNLFDGTIVILSLVEILMSAATGSSGGGIASTFRAFRLLRIFKMAKSWTALNNIIDSFGKALPKLGYVTVLMMLYMFIAAVAGMQLFGVKIPAAERMTYRTFGVSMLTVFQMLTFENWNEIMYNSIHFSNDTYGCVVYYILVILVGNFLILNLFLAVLLADIDTGGEFDVKPILKFLCFCCPGKAGATPEEEEAAEAAAAAAAKAETETKLKAEAAKAKQEEEDRAKKKNKQAKKKGKGSDDGDDYVNKQPPARRRTSATFRTILAEEAAATANDSLYEETGYSLGCLGPNNWFRVQVSKFAFAERFTNFILLCIVVSSILLAVDGPALDDKSDTKKVINMLDIVFTAIFVVEMTSKIIAMGFAFTPDAYIKDSWNQLDFVIVIVSVVSLPFVDPQGNAPNYLKVLRTLRVLRPLRTIQRAPGIKIIVTVLLSCAPVFVNIILVSFLFYLIFAIMGVQLFAGKFYTCNDLLVRGVDECWGYYMDPDEGELLPRVWSKYPMHFDNVAMGLLSLFEISGLELWFEPMYFGMDAPKEIGQQPKFNQMWPAAFYFCGFIVVGAFVVLNLFVGAVVDQFNEAKAEGGSVAMTDEQQAFVDSMRLVLFNKPTKKPSVPVWKDANGRPTCWGLMRLQAYKIVQWDSFSTARTGTSFDLCIAGLIIINTLVMACYTFNSPAEGKYVEVGTDEYYSINDTEQTRMLNFANDVLMWMFFVEMVLKLVGIGPKSYWEDNWNKFDGIVVTVSVANFFVIQLLSSFNMPINPSIFRILRCARLARAFRLIKFKAAQGVVRLLETLLITLPALANVASLLFLAMFIFSVLAMNFFGDIPLDQEMKFGSYNEHANFRYFHTSMISLFRFATGESWTGFMHDVMAEKPAAWFFFVAYMLFVAYLLFNLLVAVVLDQFGSSSRQENNPITGENLIDFVNGWSVLDPGRTHKISVTALPVLIKKLDPPLGRSEGTTKLEFMEQLGLAPDGAGKVSYVDTFMALVKRFFLSEPELAANIDMASMEKDLAKQIMAAFPDLGAEEDGDGGHTADEHIAAANLQNIIRGRNAKKRVTALAELRQKHAAAREAEEKV